MRLKPWKTWGFAGRLITIAVVPAALMSVVIGFALYSSGRYEIRSDVAERGSLLAAALAESSQYAVVSGNTAPLNETLQGLRAVDPSVVAIEIINAARATLVLVGQPDTGLPEIQVHERPIHARVPDINVFDRAGPPHVSSTGERLATFTEASPAGYVRVTMSPSPLLEAKRHRIYLSLVVVLVATLVSAIAGLYLARRLTDPLSRVMTALRGIREGNYKVELDAPEAGELGELQTTIVEMAKGLGATRQELEDKVAERTRELQNAMEVAKLADIERRRLIAQVNAAIEEERRHIANEIHDHLNASLIVLKLSADRLRELAGTTVQHPQHQEIESLAENIASTIADLYTVGRGIVTQLRPEVLDTLGLKGAIQEMVRKADLAHSGCGFVFRADPDFPPLNRQLTIAAYRVVQEALSNIIKHAKATEVTVSLWRNQASVCIKIEDNGVGFDPLLRKGTGIGLIGMRERVTAAGGEFKVESSSSGTCIVIELPTEELPAAQVERSNRA